MFDEACKQMYDFRKIQMIRSFDKSIYSGKNKIDEANEKQVHLLEYILEFNSKIKPKNILGREKAIFFIKQKFFAKVEICS